MVTRLAPAEGESGLENRCALTGTVGSNPSPPPPLATSRRFLDNSRNSVGFARFGSPKRISQTAPNGGHGSEGMRLMANIVASKKTGIYHVRLRVPADLREAFGGKAEIWRSL